MAWITDPGIWIALLTLTSIEIVLGVDNIVFISILAGKLPKEKQERARILGLAVAMITRILLLLSLTWVMRLTQPLFHVFAQELSGRDLILLGGGVFLLAKSTLEIHENLEQHEEKEKRRQAASFMGVIAQIAVLDLVFSLDSVITAIGLAEHIPVMVTAIVVAVIVMMFSARAISSFIDKHPTVKILALSFLLLIGVALVAEAFELHLPKGYIYFAMAFSVFVEMLNLRIRGAGRAKRDSVSNP
ncbi:TerC family protein [bacterium]|nr:TerC family protein [bacterium]